MAPSPDQTITDADIMAFTALAYAIRHRVSTLRPGNHASRSPGAYGRFNGLRRLTDDMDPKRLDIRASLTDPFETAWVRKHWQATASTVTILVDLSGSMGFAGSVSRHAVACGLAAGLARAALRSGDRVQVIALRDGAEAFVLEPTRRGSAPREVADALAGIRPSGRGLSGLAEAGARLPPSASLVFVISDFQAPVDETRAFLASVEAHDVRPIVLADPVLAKPPPSFGFVHLDDLETGRRRIAVMRPSLARRWQADAAAHAAALDRLFLEAGCRPATVDGPIDTEALFEAIMGGEVAA